MLLKINYENQTYPINLNEKQNLNVFYHSNDYDTSGGCVQISSTTSLKYLWEEIKNIDPNTIVGLEISNNNEIIYETDAPINSIGYNFSFIDATTVSYKINFVLKKVK